MKISCSNTGRIYPVKRILNDEEPTEKTACYVAETEYGAGIFLPEHINELVEDEYIINLQMTPFSSYKDAEELLRVMAPELDDSKRLTLNRLYNIESKGDYSIIVANGLMVISRNQEYIDRVLYDMRFFMKTFDIATKLTFEEAQACAYRIIMSNLGSKNIIIPFNIPTESVVIVDEIIKLLGVTEH